MFKLLLSPVSCDKIDWWLLDRRKRNCSWILRKIHNETHLPRVTIVLRVFSWRIVVSLFCKVSYNYRSNGCCTLYVYSMCSWHVRWQTRTTENGFTFFHGKHIISKQKNYTEREIFGIGTKLTIKCEENNDISEINIWLLFHLNTKEKYLM